MPPTRPPNGVEFPKNEKGERPTTSVNQGTFAAAVKNVDPAAAEQVEKARGWRFSYAKHVVNQVKLAVKSNEAAYKIAEDGEHYLHNQMTFVRGDDEMPLSQAMAKYTAPEYKTAVVKGQGVKTPGYSVPYRGKTLQGAELNQQIEQWVRQGVIELSCGASLQRVLQNPRWTDLSDKYFVLFGAASAMGPFPLLMAMGANVIAVDLNREGIWKKLIETARGSPGTLIFPTSEDPAGKSDEDLAKIAGCDLLAKTPEVRTWVMEQQPDKQLICGAYAYLDGPLFVKLSVAMDAIIKDLVAKRKVKPALAYLCTPTDAHVVPQAAMQAARSNFNKQPMWQSLLALLLSGAGKFRMTKNHTKPVEGTEHSVVDAIVPDQGPNYILAKRLQHWRAILSRRDGCIVSTNIAPSTATKSVVSNRMFALAYQGMHHFKPVEVFYEDTSNAVMTGLLLADINDATSAANPQTVLPNPMCLFSENSFHGGAWRCAYKFGSVGTPSVLAALVTQYVAAPYMMAYNFAQAFGWGCALVGLLQHEAEGGSDLWGRIGATVTFFQYLAGLEMVHSLLGMTRSGFMTTLVQLMSRFLVVATLNDAAAAGTAPSPFFLRMMLFAWSLTEVIRYTFYGTPVKIPALTWLRYTLFIVLYPMGVTGEIGCLNHSATQAPQAQPYNVLYLVQKFFSFGGLPALIFVYVSGLYGLYTHMLAQRAKVLGGCKKTKKAAESKKNQ